MSNSDPKISSDTILNKVSRVIEGTDERFTHTFGGPARHKGTTPLGCELPLHLIYTIDTADPSFPFQLPGIRHLPLYYSFPYNAGACGYRVKSENEIQVLYMETKKLEPDFPYQNYPREFPERRVSLVPLTYEQHKTLVYYLEADKEGLNAEDREWITEEMRYPFTQIGGIHKMWQGIPNVACPNRDCSNSKYNCFMEVFAVVWNEPHKGIFLWEHPEPKRYLWQKEGSFYCDVQVIFQICPKCFSIHACNRCT